MTWFDLTWVEDFVGCSDGGFFFYMFLLSFSCLELSNTKVYEPSIRAFLETAAHFCEVVVLKLRIVLDPARSLRAAPAGVPRSRNRDPLGPYSRTMPVVLRWS